MSSIDPAAAAREAQQRVQEQSERLQRLSQEQHQQIQQNLQRLEQYRQQQMQQMRQQQQIQQAAAARDQQLRYHRGQQEQQARLRAAPLAPPRVQSNPAANPALFVENKRVSDLRLQNMRDLREQYQLKGQVAPEQMPQRADMPWQDFALQKEQAFRDRQADLQKQINEQPNAEARQRLELVKAHEYHSHKEEQLGNTMAFQGMCNDLTNQPDGQKEQMAQWKAEREAHQEQAAAALEKLQELDRKQEAGRTNTTQADHAQVPTAQQAERLREVEKEHGFGQSQQQGQNQSREQAPTQDKTADPTKEATNKAQVEKPAELSYADKIAQQRQEAAKNPPARQNEDTSARDEIHGHRQTLDREVSEPREQAPTRQVERDKDHEQDYAR